jgi:hypothetical protein
LDIKTFDNATGPSVFFKAAGHPLAVDKAKALIAKVAAVGPVAIFDPDGAIGDFAALYDISAWQIADVFVQRIEDLPLNRFGRPVRPVSQLGSTQARTILISAFDATRLKHQITPVLPTGAQVLSFDELRLPPEMITNPKRYLDPLNFACDFVLFRDADGWHSRVGSGNYWHSHGATATKLWCRLFGHSGNPIGDWWHELPPAVASLTIDSREVRQRLGLSEFAGSLFLHAVGAAGHDVIKYALDIYGDEAVQLSCTHDSNPWPADFYAGLPAPAEGERVNLLLQNCHPAPIPAGAIALNVMGSDNVRTFTEEVPPFGTAAVDIAALFPDARWPQQLEINAGRHIGRPRYEIASGNRRRYIAHANVERTDLKPDPMLPELIGGLIGKGYLLTGSVPPMAEWQSWVLPTPMARGQHEVPLQIAFFDPEGKELARRSLGRLPRDHAALIDTAELVGSIRPEYGHVELSYDLSQGGEADGWLHALFRYRRKESGQFADTSFGSHLYNLPISYKKEPQSYIGRPPGLSTRLFLRLGRGGDDTICHLIYPSSAAIWHARSTTSLVLHDGQGREIAQRDVQIAQNGSLFWRYSEMFEVAERRAAGEGAYVMIRDVTCRLFGYHGLVNEAGGFAFDHMFGF